MVQSAFAIAKAMWVTPVFLPPILITTSLQQELKAGKTVLIGMEVLLRILFPGCLSIVTASLPSGQPTNVIVSLLAGVGFV